MADLTPEPAPSAVPLMDMNYVIRMRGNSLGISAFAYEVDARIMLNHIGMVHKDCFMDGRPIVFELVNNRTGTVMYSSDEPS